MDARRDTALPGAVRWFATLIRPYRRRLAVAVAALMLGGAVSLILPAVAGQVVDAALVERSLARLKGVILGMLGIFAVSGVLHFVETYSLRSAAAMLVQDLRAALHGHLLTLTPAFFESQRTGDLLSRLNADVDQVASTLTDELVSGLQQGLILVGALAVLFILHPGLTGVMLLAVPPVIVAAVLFGLRFEKLGKQRQDAVAEAGVAAEESLSGIRTVQAFAREPEERARYRGLLAKATVLSLRGARTWGAFGGVISFLAFSALTLVLWYGGTLVIEGRLTAGQLTSFLLYTLSVAGAVGSITALYGGLKQAQGAIDRVRRILETKPAIEDGVETRLERGKRLPVAFRDVTFRYPTAERPALDRVALEIAAGECVALVGPSGAGKSTMVSLLLRFYDPQEGAVLVDGAELRRLRLSDVRGAIGLVPQEIFLFGGTIAENIRTGRAGAAEAEVRAAAEAAQAHGFIEKLPKGYDTVVGERGVKLSAGERQRIAIARVFLKDPGIVVLDEATSALDAESEHLVQKALDRLLTGRTTIMIAHRLATVRRAARVVLMTEGRIADLGRHEELMERNDLYRHLCELQMLAEAK